MNTVREQDVYDALRAVKDPDLHKDIVELGFVKNLRIDKGAVAFDIELTTPACPVKELMKDQATQAVGAVPGVSSVQVNMTAQVRRAAVSMTEGGMAQVRNPIAIASGKGGVGKSTVATNLALALARRGARVGLMDADVYGPSVPMMLGGAADRPQAGSQQGWIRPVERHGVKYMSMGLLTGPDTPVIWRGPMATKLIQQFLGQVDWGDLDYLLIDLPPGTGDVQLTLTQSAPLVGAVIVTTPQDVAVGVTMRGLRMFEQVRVPILGIVENMSGFVCEHCGHTTDVFRQGGGKKAAEEAGIPFLGGIPLDPSIAESGDSGTPVVARQSEPASTSLRAALVEVERGDSQPALASARAFMEVAGRLAQEVSIVNEKTLSVKHRPTEVQLADDAVVVRWSDLHLSKFPFRELRLGCPCAMCVDEWTGEARLDPAQVPRDVQVLDVRHVGRYALQFSFSDGHSSGIYSYDKLRSLDPKALA